jgi:hypothetical protein
MTPTAQRRLDGKPPIYAHTMNVIFISDVPQVLIAAAACPSFFSYFILQDSERKWKTLSAALQDLEMTNIFTFLIKYRK